MITKIESVIIVNKVNYYELLPDGEEKALNEEDATRTTKKIKETIGSEKDFEMLVLATEKNLDDLIGLTTSESGKVLTRLIGLEILELKEKAVREMYNEFARKKKSNEYDVITLTDEIQEHTEKGQECSELETTLNERLEKAKNDIKTLTNEKESLINNKEKIDVTISELNPESLESEIEKITEKGTGLAKEVKEHQTKIDVIGVVVFDEDVHFDWTKQLNQLNTDIALKEADARNCVLILTTNLGAQDAEKNNIGFGDSQDKEYEDKELKKFFSPEFRNRLDGIITFGKLTKEVMMKVVGKFLVELKAQVADKNVEISITNESLDALVDRGFDNELLACVVPRANVFQL